MVSALQENAIKNLREARGDLLSTQKQNLTFQILREWVSKNRGTLLAAGQIAGSQAMAYNSINNLLLGYENTLDKDILDAVRDSIVESLDATTKKVDGKQIVRPVLDELILRVKDTKLAALLNEFNASKDGQPNLAAIGFRTILCLVIIEIAKIRQPNSKLAARIDFALDPIIQEALDSNLFDNGESRLVKRFRDGPKVTLDIVAHKPGNKSLIVKDDLSSVVDSLLNHLLKVF
jgi:hypothetical protein